MIPYYNALIVPYNNRQLIIDRNQVLQAFFAQSLLQPRKLHPAKIYIHQPQQSSQQLKNKMRAIIEQLSIGLFKVNDTYTLSAQRQIMYTGLSQVLVREGQSKKGPARLQNLQLLSQYFQKFKSEAQMKDFLKNLLIEEISHEKKCIKYRSRQEIQVIIRVMLANLNGEITIITGNQQQSPKQEEIVIEIVLIDANKLTRLSLQSIVKYLEDSYRVRKTHDSQLTITTINALVKRAQAAVQEIALKYNLIANTAKKEIKDFLKTLRHLATLKAILAEGIRLVEEQKALKEAFLQFVQQMTVKSTNQISRYFKGFQNQLQFKSCKATFQLKQRYISMISGFIKTSLQIQSYKGSKYQWKAKNCNMIQQRIRSFLINRRQKYQYFNSFAEQQEKQRQTMAEYYQKLIQYYNRNEIKKLKEHNRFKYGFSCCTFILELKNHSNYRCFDPNNILNLIQRTNKSQEPIAIISCNRSCLQFLNIEGKKYQIGNNLVVWQKQNGENNKQNNNTISNYNSCYHSARNVSSLCRSSGNVLRSTRYSCNVTQPKTKNKSKIIRIADEDYEFLIDEMGYLYGRGRNQLGQLGLGAALNITQFTLIFKYQKIKYVSSANKHSVAVTIDNKIYYFGREKGDLQSSKTPRQLPLSLGVIKQVVCSIDCTYFLTENNRIYSVQSQNYLRIPKQMSLTFDNYAIIRTGTYNLQIVYVVAYWTNSLDPTQRNQIAKFLTNHRIRHQQQHPDSILVESTADDQPEKGRNYAAIGELSAILEESDF